MTILICNIGGRDLACSGLPKHELGERAWAAALAERYAALRPMLRLPILGKALRALAAQEVALDALILVASDQPAPALGAEQHSFWRTDTGPTAHLIARLLAEGAQDVPRVPAERVQVWTLADEHGVGVDPSDYDLALAYLERRLAALAQAHPAGPVLLEVAGGTPAMTTALLIAGVEVFGARAEALAIHPQRTAPSTLGVGRRLLAAPLRATLRSHAATFAYDAALRTLVAQREAIADRLAPGAAASAEALLRYAYARYNFDFVGAREAGSGKREAGSGKREARVLGDGSPWDSEWEVLVAQVTAPDRAALLAEVLHGAEARYATGLYADFLTQLVRFEENALRMLCLARGVAFVRRDDGSPDDDGSLISRAWLREQPFQLKQDYDDGRDRPNSRTLMRELVGHLARERGEALRPLLDALDRLRPLVYLRNDTTHSLDGLRQVDLARRFTTRQRAAAHEANQILPHLKQLYTSVTGQPLPASPFPVINGLLDRLLVVGG
ncbi:MAG: hypothetical protein EI684_21755 [Candidatus Viridilinea halotolerans]|uniref:TIGR02710 family CRISPR-associated protein n=1 Tax=Candidatus Viridilinea halotolerans TaxID=2491704 RepID=A0A426TR90_9CHLR|nr:MAG: hypothetical protein EI684_21755 [Candidatus Viridilinea halotolerans]